MIKNMKKKVISVIMCFTLMQLTLICSMFTVAAFAKDYDAKVSIGTVTGIDDIEIFVPERVDMEPGDTFAVEFKLADSATTKLSDYSFAVTLDDEASKQFVCTSSKDYKFVFSAVGNYNTSVNDVRQCEIRIDITGKNGQRGVVNLTSFKSYFGDGKLVDKSVFENLKKSNKDATVKASYVMNPVKNGSITITDVNIPVTINTTMASNMDAKFTEYLDGKNYAFAGYKYVQPLPGTGIMRIDLSTELLLAGAERVFVYKIEGDNLILMASSAKDKMYPVKEQSYVEFPVSSTGKYIITDKALSGTTTGTNKNPGTGAADMVGAAVVMALVAGAGIVAFNIVASKNN